LAPGRVKPHALHFIQRILRVLARANIYRIMDTTDPGTENVSDGHRQPFKDHFSGHAGDYARHRPDYPQALFDWLASIAASTGTAWDVACGNGQAAIGLAGQFRRVVASDASAEQVRRAVAHPRVDYFVARAEASGLAARSINLITVAQAAHWFDMAGFAREVRRVARPGGVIAVWCYALAKVTPEIDDPVAVFYEKTLEPYWPPERDLIEDAYRTLPFPFDEIEPPPFEMVKSWTLDAFLSYLGTWSAYRRSVAAKRDDPLPALGERLASHWGPGEREVRWPIHLRVGLVAS
jgi:SAM-dependent methyltransferase